MTRLTLTARTRLNTYANVSRKQSDKETFDMSIPGVPDEFEELMPCPACPDGYVWNSNGPTRKPCPVCKGYAAVGYRAAQAARPPREPTQTVCAAGCKAVPEAELWLDQARSIWRAMYDAWQAEQTSGAAQAVTDGPAADPIADLCERLRALHIIDEVGSDNPLGRDAADALERLARVSDSWRKLAQENGDDKRALMDERDTLRAVVRAADAMRRAETGIELAGATVAYDRARAAWKGEGQ